MINVYQAIKDMPNPSPGLINYFKRNRYKRIWAYKSHSYDKDFVKLADLKKMPLRDVALRIGSPSAYANNSEKFSKGIAKGQIQANCFSGTTLRDKMFSGRGNGDVFLVGIGTKTKPTWFIDVTEEVIKQLTTIGACALSKPHCDFELISPRVKKCKYCGRKLKGKVVVSKNTYWEEA